MTQVQQTENLLHVAIPQALTMFALGFDANNEYDAKALFEQAIKPISHDCKISKAELKNCYNIYRRINPQDDTEKIQCALFIIAHILGMHNLMLPSFEDVAIGIQLLKVAVDSMERIYQKRNDIESLSS